MKFNPEKCAIADERMKPFIDADELWKHLQQPKPDAARVREIIAKSLNKERLTLAETAALILADEPELIEEIKNGARELKKKVYGNRIVLFAPLYIGNHCINNCKYCGFKASNKFAVRRTLTDEEIIKETEALEDNGQKRLILVYGEHPKYSPEYIAHTVGLVYGVKKGNGEIRRVNINAAPLEIEGFRTVKESGIGTYQVFQETYHPEAYKLYHPSGPKKDFDYRLTSLDRAQEAGVDDVGIGALFGLYDWRFEVMGLVRHTNHLEAVYNVGPHTISFPRIKDASEFDIDPKFEVSDDDFVRIIAILRLAVPYTGMIMSTRESARTRSDCLEIGITQISGGSRTSVGGYNDEIHEDGGFDSEETAQFDVDDRRTLGEVVDWLISIGYVASFCTACYREGRTGDRFMSLLKSGQITNCCQPNALLTLKEYLNDYASPETRRAGEAVIQAELEHIASDKVREKTREYLQTMEQDHSKFDFRF
ncbi:MAG: [FeFe] hydrogenase H-cluster radical SAM maturase HydG [Clostridia bacterium]|nr:[FeFe] hydrogenase H-cluster radical SAM maturase HydG [Clostridia bacterium]